jgi:GAF domain-containing protein/Sel1 repeat-containing protein
MLLELSTLSGGPFPMLGFYHRGPGHFSREPIWPAKTRSDLTLVPNLEHHPWAPSERAAGQGDRMQEIVEYLKVSTGADGAAIAIEHNGVVMCRASAGDCAPSVDAILNRESGLSGLCLRSGELVRCDDAGCDLRVNAEVADELGVLSVLAVPVRHKDHTVGVVEVLSRTSHAFGSSAEETAYRAAARVLHRLAEKSPSGDESLQLISGYWETTAAALAQVEEVQQRDDAAVAYTIFQGFPDALPNVPVKGLSEPSAERQPEPSKCTETPAVDISDPRHIPETTLAYESLPLSGVKSTAVPALRSVVMYAAILAILGVVGAGFWGLTNRGVAKQPAAAAPASSVPDLSHMEKLRQAAFAGDAGAQYELAMRHLSGDGVARSESVATTWLLKSAHQGNNSAQYQLGLAYEQGIGVQQDYVKAYACFAIAATNGNAESDTAQRVLTPKLTDQEMADARILIGLMYKNGIGTRADNAQAYMWFALAEAAGSPQGQEEKALIASKMSRAQVAIANGRASEWLQRRSQAPR